MVTFLLGAATADGTHIDQAITELNEGAALHRQSEGRHVTQGKVDETLQLLFPHVVLDALQSEKEMGSYED